MFNLKGKITGAGGLGWRRGLDGVRRSAGRDIANRYGEPCACGLHCASLEVHHQVSELEWKGPRSFLTQHRLEDARAWLAR